MDNLLTRLTASLRPVKEIRALFNSKNTSTFVTVFKKFTEIGEVTKLNLGGLREDAEFGAFLKWFVDGGNKTEIDGKTWDMLYISHSTRDASVVHGKIDYLVTVMEQYFKETHKAA